MILITKKIDGLRAVEMFTQTDTSSISRGDAPLKLSAFQEMLTNDPWLHERWGFPIQIGAIFEKCLELNSVEEAESFARIVAENPGSIEELKRLLRSSPVSPPQSTPDMDQLTVKIDYEEKDLQKQVKEAGGKWDKKKKAWILPPSQVEILGLRDRVI